MSNTLSLSLRALRHPLTLTSVAVLLINDHWLKAAAPSVLTGKLSDFAGLFFFPFLLAALLSAARLPPRLTFVLALSLTGTSFALMKTTLWGNALARALWGTLVGGPVNIVLDPTDCWALVMLFPAWLLWRSLERERAPQPPGKLALAALGVAVLASLATTVPPPPPSIIRLAQDNETIYAKFDYVLERTDSEYVMSKDQGLTWETIQAPPLVISDTLQTKANFPLVACVSSDSQVCYQLPDATRVEASVDKGQNWKTAWELPWGRLDYMQRKREEGHIQPDLLEDMIVIGDASGYIVVATMGNEGILRRKTTGEWERIGVRWS